MSNGIVVDMTSWDGADIFGVRNYEFVFCSRRAAEVTLKAGYNRHVTFVRLENWGRWDEFDIHKWEAKAYKEYVEGFLIRQPEDL